MKNNKIGKIFSFVGMIGAFVCFCIFAIAGFSMGSGKSTSIGLILFGFIGFGFFGILSAVGGVINAREKLKNNSNNFGVDETSIQNMRELSEKLKKGGRKRCGYCGAFNEEKADKCSSCGARFDE